MSYETTKFSCYLTDYRSLPEHYQIEASNNGCGKGLANYIVIEYNGEIINVESDAMEPEDTTFSRDLHWITDEINRAYSLGLQDGKESVNSILEDNPKEWTKLLENTFKMKDLDAYVITAATRDQFTTTIGGNMLKLIGMLTHVIRCLNKKLDKENNKG